MDRPIVKCPHCGWKAAETRLCGACGGPLTTARDDVAVHSSAPR